MKKILIGILASFVVMHGQAQDQIFSVKGVTFKMISVQGGKFMMGDEEHNNEEGPVHEVTLSSYHIGETEVTQELWETVMGYNPSRNKGSKNPVEYVSWTECNKFITKLNSLTGKRFRLPTEAEWEFAARGGNKSQGYKYSGSNKKEDVRYDDNQTHPVKTKIPNELGIYNMTGNAYEWCSDWYGYYPSYPVTNPTGASEMSGRRVIRNGYGITDRRKTCPADRCYDLGLRLAY